MNGSATPRGSFSRFRSLLGGSRRLQLGLTVGISLLLLLGAAAIFSGRTAPKSAEPTRVGREDLVMTVEVTGELAAVRTTEIGPPPLKDIWDFKISFLSPESAVVKKGQPIVAFDTQQLEKSLEEKSAEFAEASKQIERKEIDLQMQLRAEELSLAEANARLGKARLKTDVPEELKGRIEAIEARLELSDAEKEVANLESKLASTRSAGEAELRSLKSKRDRAKGRVEDLRDSIEAMKVEAPQDGIVIYKTGWRDEKKKVGDSTWVGEKLLELPDLKEMKAKGEVDEADAGQIAVGQKVKLRLEARPDIDFTGRVRGIGQTVRRQSWRVPTKIYSIDVALDRTDPAVMRPAMRFRGEIETARIPGRLLAPRESIFLRPTGPVVWAKKGYRYEERPVRLGRSNKTFVEVLSGLAEGDFVSTTELAPAEPARRRGPLSAGL